MKLLILAVLGLGLSSCSKEVSNNSSNLTSRTNPVVEVPSDTNSGVLKINFANHATANEPEDEISRYSLSEPLLLTLPNTFSTITYSSSSYKPSLTVMVNNQAVCVYVWSSGSYKMSQSCYVELDLTSNDVITVSNIPKSQTISISVQFQR